MTQSPRNLYTTENMRSNPQAEELMFLRKIADTESASVLLRILKAWPAIRVRIAIASNEYTPPDDLDILADDKWNIVREMVALNPSVSPDTLLRLCQDKCVYVNLIATIHAIKDSRIANNQICDEILYSSSNEKRWLLANILLCISGSIHYSHMRKEFTDFFRIRLWHRIFSYKLPSTPLYKESRDTYNSVYSQISDRMRDLIASLINELFCFTQIENQAEILEILSNDECDEIRKLVAENPNISDQTRNRLKTDNNFWVSEYAIQRPSIFDTRIFEKGLSIASQSASHYPDTTLLTKLIISPTLSIKLGLLQDKILDGPDATRYANDALSWVRECTAAHANTHKNARIQLTHDPQVEVRENLLEHSRGLGDILPILLEDKEPAIGYRLAGLLGQQHKSTIKGESLTPLVRSPDPDVRRAVVESTFISSDVLEPMCNDSINYVSATAKYVLKWRHKEKL